MNRIDKVTSGAVVLAKTQKAHGVSPASSRSGLWKKLILRYATPAVFREVYDRPSC